MRPSTEDLLSVRDGEPLDAATRAALDASPQSAVELERLRGVQRSLQALPQLEAPAGAWERIVAAEQRARTARRRAATLFAGFGAAAAIAMAALIYVVAGRPNDDAGAGAALADQGRSSPWLLTASTEPASYAQLVAESARLERLLAELPPQAPVVRLGTMSTIVGLEDRISLLDEQLSYGAASGLESPQRTALWSERVDLMSALVFVRAAQAQGNLFQTVEIP